MQLVRGYFQYSDIKEYKREAIKAAEELGYGEAVISKIKAATTETQIGNIMAEARKGSKH